MERLIDMFNEQTGPVLGHRPKYRRGILGSRALSRRTTISSKLFDFTEPQTLIPTRTINDRSEHPSETQGREQRNSIFWSSEMQNVLDPTKTLGTQDQDIATHSEVLALQAQELPIDNSQRTLYLNSEDVEALKNANIMRSSKSVPDHDAAPHDAKVHNRVAASYHSVARRGIDTENGYHAAQLEKRHKELIRMSPETFRPLEADELEGFEGYQEEQRNAMIMSFGDVPKKIPKPPHGDRVLHKRRRVEFTGDSRLPGGVAPVSTGGASGDSPLCDISPTLSPQPVDVETPTAAQNGPGSPMCQVEDEEILSGHLQSTEFANLNVRDAVNEFAGQQRVGFMPNATGGGLVLSDNDILGPEGFIESGDHVFLSGNRLERETSGISIIGPSSLFMNSYATSASSIEGASMGARPVVPYRKVFSKENNALESLFDRVKIAPRPEFRNAYFNTCIRAFSIGPQTGFHPKDINTDVARCVLPEVPREMEEYCMREPLPRENECIYQDQCQGIKVGHGRGFVLVSLDSAIATRGPTVPDEIRKAMIGDMCILCRRYLVMIGCVAVKTSAVKNACENFTVSTWINIVGQTGEYCEDDCEMPCGNGYDGIYGPIARHGYFNYEHGIMTLYGYQVKCYFQKHRKPGLDRVVDF